MEEQPDLIGQVLKSRQEYITDGYSMSIGELVSMYRDNELIINPDFQRKFRWSLQTQSRLIESILIGVPLPSIFVFQNEKGQWEVVDGVQRISTILAFMGELRDKEGKKQAPTILEKTKMLPLLKDITWSTLPKEPLQLDFKRSKLEIKIIKSMSHKNAKFEVFQRLNYAPTILSGQEYRNALLIMINKEFFDWIENLGNNEDFKKCIDLTERWLDEKYDQELILRLFVFPKYPLKGQTKVDDYLNESIFYEDDSIINMISRGKFSLQEEEAKFIKTFNLLVQAKGEEVFQKPGKGQQFLESYYEAIAIGLYWNIGSYDENDLPLLIEKIDGIEEKIPKALNTTSRIPKTVAFGKEYFSK